MTQVERYQVWIHTQDHATWLRKLSTSTPYYTPSPYSFLPPQVCLCWALPSSLAHLLRMSSPLYPPPEDIVPCSAVPTILAQSNLSPLWTFLPRPSRYLIMHYSVLLFKCFIVETTSFQKSGSMYSPSTQPRRADTAVAHSPWHMIATIIIISTIIIFQTIHGK